MKGIRRKLILSYAAVSILTIGIFQVMFYAGITHYYRWNIEQSLSSRAFASSEFYNSYMKYERLEDKAKYMMENFSLDEYLEMQIIDKNGNVLESSSGFYSSEYVDTPDFKGAVERDETGSWIGENAGTFEKVISVSAPLYYADEITGAVRYITSMEGVDKTVNALIARIALVGVAALIAALVVSSLLGRGIIRPIKSLREISEKMAGGDFSLRADIKNEDEIGELADALNYMADEIVKSNSVKDEFISSISHEIRTPLTAIKGWSETILGGDMDDEEETREGLQIIASETDRLIKLVEELLDFSRFSSKKMTLKRDNVDIIPVCTDTVRQFWSKAQSKGVSIVCRFEKNTLNISCDRDRIRQVLINLMENATKYGEEEIHVRVGVEGLYAYICVEDDGCGIPDDDMEKVKEKFYKGNPNMPGSGLGLSISDEIASLHGGRIEISTSILSGASVKLMLPLE